MLHLNVCSCHVMYAFQSESTLYSCLNVKELLAPSRCEIWSLSDCNWTQTRYINIDKNINIDNYISEYTPTESSKEGTLLYIDKSRKYKLRKDFNFNKPKKIQLAFTEILRPIRKTVTDCIYKHPKISIKEFLNDYLQPLLIKLSFEKKKLL